MADPTYYIPGAAIHSFLMFAPFFALYEKKGMIVQGVFLWMSGPMLASFITDNLMEQASIWCFFSIAQISTVRARPPHGTGVAVEGARVATELCPSSPPPVRHACAYLLRVCAPPPQMLFLIRETLIVHWGKDSDHRQSLLESRAAYKAKKQAAQNGHAANGKAAKGGKKVE